MLENYRSPWMTEDLESFNDMVQRFAKEYLEPNELKWREQHYADRSAWLKAGELGLILPDVAEEYGGAGGTIGHYVCVIQAMNANGRRLGIGLSHIVAHYILESGTEAQKKHWLPKIGSGRTHLRHRDDRTGRRLRPAIGTHPRREERRQVRHQRRQDVHQQRPDLRHGAGDRQDRHHARAPRAFRCSWSTPTPRVSVAASC